MRKAIATLLATITFLSLVSSTSAYVTSPSDTSYAPEIHYIELFQLLPAFVHPNVFLIYENLTSKRADEDETIGEKNLPRVCRVHSNCKGTVEICSVDNPNDCRIEKVGGICERQNPSDLEGLCDYTKPAIYQSLIIGSDFSESDGENLAIEKIQSFRNSTATTTTYDNNLNYGAHQLLLSEQELTRLRIIHLRKAVQTRATVTSTGEFPLGWIDWKKELPCPSGPKTPAGLYSQTPDAVRNLDEGWYDLFLEAIEDDNQWAQDLACAPIYRTNEEAGYTYASICFVGVCLDQQTQNGGDASDIYSDPITGAYDAVKLDAKMRLPKDSYDLLYDKIQSQNVLVDYIDCTRPNCTPSRILSTYRDTGNYVGPISLIELGRITNFRKKLNAEGLSLITDSNIQEAGAVKEEVKIDTASILVKFLQLFFKVQEHHITIPGPAGQAINLFKRAVNRSIDVRSELKTTTLKGLAIPLANPDDNNSNESLSNALVTKSGTSLQAGAPESTVSRIRALQFFACAGGDYSNEDTQIIDYISGERNTCAISTTTPPIADGACNGKLFKKLYGSEIPSVSNKGQGQVDSQLPNISDKAYAAYKVAEDKTGVPCEILAGIHWKESSNNDSKGFGKSLTLSGTLEASAIRAATLIKTKAGGNIGSIKNIIAALSRYNGGGNANCGAGDSFDCSATPASGRCGWFTECDTNPDACTCPSQLRPADTNSCRSVCSKEGPNKFPFPFNYSYCPTKSEGYDDPYVVNFMSSPEHDSMYILFEYDCTQTQPRLDSAAGAFTFAVGLYNTLR